MAGGGFELFAQGVVGTDRVCELRLERLDLQHVGRRIDTEQHIALFTGRFGLDRHLDDAAAHLRHDGNGVLDYPYVGLDGANRLSSMISVNMPTTGIVTTMTCEVVFQGRSLNLKKISQTINA